MEILNSCYEDIDEIFKLYEEAIAYQQQVKNNNWIGFERSLIEREISEKRHFKIMEKEEIACSFVIADSDPLIWKEKDADPALYIHRIATNPLYRGRFYVKHIVDWLRVFAEQHHKLYLRMDTTSGNDKLNQYYISCGFTYQGVTTINWNDTLPAHYKNNTFSLFEIKLDEPPADSFI